MNQSPSSLALFGHPVAHSLSPRIHAAFGEQCGVAIRYALCDVKPHGFAAAVRRFFAEGGHGANVTVPHKRAAFALADAASEAASRAGGANVLRCDAQGRLLADNTDGSGLLADLVTRRGLGLSGMRVLLLGAGGAARGVAGPLLEAGITSLLVANRTLARAEALAADHGAGVQAVGVEELTRLAPLDLIIHATSAGHAGAALALPSSLVKRTTVCCDLTYGSAACAFVDWACSAGAAQAFDGLGMLVEQAADSFALWFGQRPRSEPVYRQLRGG